MSDDDDFDGEVFGGSQADLAYERTRALVRNGTYTANSVLTEQSLANEAGIGRTPVREAVSRLVSEGLLMRLPGRGLAVRSLTAKELGDLYEVREWLEALCVRRAAHSLDEIRLANLRMLVDRAQNSVACGVSWAEYREMDESFHRELWRAGRNSKAEEILSVSYESAMLDPWLDEIANIPYQNERSVKEHDEIVVALEQRDPDAAEKAMRNHAQSYRTMLAKQIFGTH